MLTKEDVFIIRKVGLSTVGEEVELLSDPYISEYYDEYQVLINSPFDDCR